MKKPTKNQQDALPAGWRKPTQEEIDLFWKAMDRVWGLASEGGGPRNPSFVPELISYATDREDKFTVALLVFKDGLRVGASKRNTYAKTADPDRPEVGQAIAFSRAVRAIPFPPQSATKKWRAKK